MKPRNFNLRLDQTPGANIQRLYAYIRSHQPNYQPAPKLLQKAQAKALLRRVK